MIVNTLKHQYALEKYLKTLCQSGNHMAALHFQSDNLNSTQRLQPAVNSVEVFIPIAAHPPSMSSVRGGSRSTGNRCDCYSSLLFERSTAITRQPEDF